MKEGIRISTHSCYLFASWPLWGEQPPPPHKHSRHDLLYSHSPKPLAKISFSSPSALSDIISTWKPVRNWSASPHQILWPHFFWINRGEILNLLIFNLTVYPGAFEVLISSNTIRSVRFIRFCPAILKKRGSSYLDVVLICRRVLASLEPLSSLQL